MTIRIRGALTVATMLATLASAGAQQQGGSPEARLRAAMDRETVDGDVTGAITSYTTLANDESAGDAVRARALVRLALASERSGRADATAHYERVVRQFPTITDAVSVASARLAARGQAASRGKTTRLVCSGPDCRGLISPDGQLLLLRPPGGVRMKDLRTGQVRMIQGAPVDAKGWVWSPDGKQIAYETSNRETGIINVAGGQPRTVFKGGYPEDWSRDGRRLLVFAGGVSDGEPNAPQRMVWVDLREGTTAVVPGVQATFLMARVSPDGQFIAFSTLRIEKGPYLGLLRMFIVRSDGSGLRELLPGGGSQDPIGWTDDGKHLIFSRDPGVWALPLANGAQSGAPVRLHEVNGSSILSLDRDRVLYYTVEGASFDVWIGELRPSDGTITPPRPAMAAMSEQNSRRLARYAPDGRRLAYASTDPRTVVTISTYSFESGETDDVKPQYRHDAGPPCWLDGGRTIVFTGRPIDPRSQAAPALVKRDVATGEEMLVPASGGFTLMSCSGQRLVGFTEKPGAPGGLCTTARCAATIRLRDSETGAGEQLYEFAQLQPPTSAAPRISRDGSMVAFVERLDATKSVLKVIATSGGAVRELATGEGIGCSGGHGHAWSHDSQYVYFCRSTGQSSEIFRARASGGSVESTGLRGPILGDLDISPDGRHIVVRWGSTNTRELWALENFLPR
jgi:Tol biopolymer transport system component